MNLFLFTMRFPYKTAEPFLINEFEFTKKCFDSISVLALFGQLKDSSLQPDKQLQLLEPVLASPNEKKRMFLKGLFNSAGWRYHVKDFFRQKVIFSPKKCYWFFISLIITRLVISSESYKKIIQQINSSPQPVLYFYWGDNLCWIIPYLHRKLKGKKVKIVLRLHGTDLYENLRGDYAPLRKQILPLVDMIVPISEYGENYLNSHYPWIKNKLFLSRLGVFDNGLNPLNNTSIKHVISVSNLIELKRVHLIFEALQRTHGQIVWHHFGDGPLSDALKDLVNQKREGLEVIWHGFVDNKSLMAFYKSQSLDLFLNLSTTEGLPVSIMEALSFGVPVIATNVGGVSELVSEKVGKLIDTNFTVGDLSGHIDWLLALDPDKISFLRKNARECFKAKVNAPDNYTKFYESVSLLFKKNESPEA